MELKTCQSLKRTVRKQNSRHRTIMINMNSANKVKNKKTNMKNCDDKRAEGV